MQLKHVKVCMQKDNVMLSVLYHFKRNYEGYHAILHQKHDSVMLLCNVTQKFNH